MACSEARETTLLDSPAPLPGLNHLSQPESPNVFITRRVYGLYSARQKYPGQLHRGRPPRVLRINLSPLVRYRIS